MWGAKKFISKMAARRILLLSFPVVCLSQNIWFPTLEAIASGRIPPPAGLEGFAVGEFPALDSPRRATPGIYARDGQFYRQQQEEEKYKKQPQEKAPQPDYKMPSPSGAPTAQEEKWQEEFTYWQDQQQQTAQRRVSQQRADETQALYQAAMGGTHPGVSEGGDRVQIQHVDVHAVRTRVEQLRQLARSVPSDAGVHAMLASQLQILDMREHSGGELPREALTHYQRALELGVGEGDEPTIFLNLGLLHSWMGNLADAADCFGRLLRSAGSCSAATTSTATSACSTTHAMATGTSMAPIIIVMRARSVLAASSPPSAPTWLRRIQRNSRRQRR